jgi:hypothetical protein
MASYSYAHPYPEFQQKKTAGPWYLGIPPPHTYTWPGHELDKGVPPRRELTWFSTHNESSLVLPTVWQSTFQDPLWVCNLTDQTSAQCSCCFMSNILGTRRIAQVLKVHKVVFFWLCPKMFLLCSLDPRAALWFLCSPLELLLMMLHMPVPAFPQPWPPS